jgi:hypothetical protein
MHKGIRRPASDALDDVNELFHAAKKSAASVAPVVQRLIERRIGADADAYVTARWALAIGAELGALVQRKRPDDSSAVDMILRELDRSLAAYDVATVRTRIKSGLPRKPRGKLFLADEPKD